MSRLPKNEPRAYGLFYGRLKAPLVQVVPEQAFPGLWRIQHPDGRLSDFGNLSRVKDAGAAICERGPPEKDRDQLHWRPHGDAPRASPVRPNRRPVSNLPEDRRAA